MKYIISILFLAVCFIAFNFFKNSDSNTTVIPKNVLVKSEKKGIIQENLTTIDDGIIEIETDIDFSEVVEQTQGMNTCGFDSSKKLSAKKIRMLTDKQKKAESTLADYCFSWFDYLESLSQLELDSIASWQRSIDKKIAVWFDENLSYEEKYAYSVKALEDDAIIFGYSAIVYLLENDHNLIAELADGIKTEEFTMMRSLVAAFDIAQLYVCEYEKWHNCGRNSLFMLELCLQDDSYCNMNYRQYLTVRYSYHQFADISDVTFHLRELINNGYPGIRIEPSD